MAQIKAGEANLSLKTMVWESGVVMVSTMENIALRALKMPWGGNTILFQEAKASREVMSEPS